MSSPNKLSNLTLTEDYVPNINVEIDSPNDMYNCPQNQSILCNVNSWMSCAESYDGSKTEYGSTYLPSTVDVQAIRECHWISSTPLLVSRRKQRKRDNWIKDPDSESEETPKSKLKHDKKHKYRSQSKSGSESSEMEESDTETETCTDSDSSFTSQGSKSKSYEDSSSDESVTSSDASESHISNTSSKTGSGASAANTHSTFSITNFDKGQLKLKIATLKSPSNSKPVLDENGLDEKVSPSLVLASDRKDQWKNNEGNSTSGASLHDHIKSSPLKQACKVFNETGTKQSVTSTILNKSSTYNENNASSDKLKIPSEEESLQEIGQDDLAAILRPESTNNIKVSKCSERNTPFNHSSQKLNLETVDMAYSDKSLEDNSEKEIELAEQLVSEAIKRIDIDMERELFTTNKPISSSLDDLKNDLEDNLPSSTTDSTKSAVKTQQDFSLSRYNSLNDISVRKVSSTSCNAVSSTVEEPVNSSVEDHEQFSGCPSPDTLSKFNSSPVTSSQMSPCQVTSTVATIKPLLDHETEHDYNSNDSFGSFPKVQKVRSSQRRLKCRVNSKDILQRKLRPIIDKCSKSPCKSQLKSKNKFGGFSKLSKDNVGHRHSSIDEVIEQVIKSCDLKYSKFKKVRQMSRTTGKGRRNRRREQVRKLNDESRNYAPNSCVGSHSKKPSMSKNPKTLSKLKRLSHTGNVKLDALPYPAAKKCKKGPQVLDGKEPSSSDESSENNSIFHGGKVSPPTESGFILRRHRHKLKNWKVKTKNIVDPVFIADMEKLAKVFNSSCHISSISVKGIHDGKNAFPIAFQYSKVNKKLKFFSTPDLTFKVNEKDIGSEFDCQKERSCKRKAKKVTIDSHKSKEKTDSNEQRLPLKKRHRHMNPQSSRPSSETSTDDYSKGCKRNEHIDKTDIKCNSKFLYTKSSYLGNDSHSFGKSKHLSPRNLRVRNEKDLLKYKLSCEAFSKSKGLSFADLSRAYSSKQFDKKNEGIKTVQPFYNSEISKVFNHDTVATIQHSVASMLSKCGALQTASVTSKNRNCDISNDVDKKSAHSAPSDIGVNSLSLSPKVSEHKDKIRTSEVMKLPGKCSSSCESDSKEYSKQDPSNDGYDQTDSKKVNTDSKDKIKKSLSKQTFKDKSKILCNETLLKLANQIKKKHRRRRQNRTGFPTIKRKKKPIIKDFTVEDVNNENINQIDIVPCKTILRDGAESMDEDDDHKVDGSIDDIHPYDDPVFIIKGDKLPRKKYLTAGLFSNYFKSVDQKIKNLEGKTKNHDSYSGALLPPPTYCSKWLRQRKIDFQLPFDLWWLHSQNLLFRNEILPSWQYRKIRTNVYYDIKPVHQEMQSCNCSVNTKESDRNCGEECLNRMIYAECTPNCPCGEKCTNQRIQKHDWAPGLQKFMTENKGWGIKTNLPIKTGEFILEYVGEVVSDKEFKNRMQDRYAKDIHHYCLNLDKGLLIDGHRMGGEGRFVNHSCEPNCEMQKWLVNGLYRMTLFAKRNIEAGEELGYDYNFSLFNRAEGQECKCGSSACRGVIGGKSQIIPKSSKCGKPEAQIVCSIKSKKAKPGRKPKEIKPPLPKTLLSKQPLNPQLKPLSHQQRIFVQEHHCFLLRNLLRMKKLKIPTAAAPSATADEKIELGLTKSTAVLLTQINALKTPRSVRTRQLAQVEDDPEVFKIARLAQVLRKIYQNVMGVREISQPIKKRSSNKKISDSDLSFVALEKKILSGNYATFQSFDSDFHKALKIVGLSSTGIEVSRMRKAYMLARQKYAELLREILGDDDISSNFSLKHNSGGCDEDVIRCICTLFHEEGLMIQCEKCLVWQHWDCLGLEGEPPKDNYLCEICSGRKPSLDIKLRPQFPDNPPVYPGQDPCEVEGVTYYLTLCRDDGLQIRQGECMYVVRDMPPDIMDQAIEKGRKSYSQDQLDTNDFDIYRVEKLWITKKGERFAFGHHYLRPHETFHEVTRKFFENEVMRVPLYEVVPLKLLIGQCWVLDLNTYCKGRPLVAKENHVYICELRVDKTAHLFAKIGKSKHSVCQKHFAFCKFEERLKPSRSYAPHEVPEHLKNKVSGCSKIKAVEGRKKKGDPKIPDQVKQHNEDTCMEIGEKDWDKKKNRLNSIIGKLLSQSSKKYCLDLSYLLDSGRRNRKKINKS